MGDDRKTNGDKQINPEPEEQNTFGNEPPVQDPKSPRKPDRYEVVES